MKKLIALLLILSMSVSLFACGQKEQNGTETETGTSETNVKPADKNVTDPESFGNNFDITSDPEEEDNPVQGYSITSNTRNDAGLVEKADPNAVQTFPSPSAAEISNERKIVEESMREMMTVLWRPDRDYTYQKTNGTLYLNAGQLYKGLPYSNGGGSFYSFSQFFVSQTNGVYNLAGLPENWEKFLSNDCCDSIMWSWAKISNSVTAKYTQMMTPKNGVLHVGEYEAPETLYSNTKQDCQDNGTQTMYQAYAKLQMGDALVHYNNNAGHAMMTVSVRVVYNITYYENPNDKTDRYETGRTIDGAKSYVYVHEQQSTGNTQTVENGETCIQRCNNDRKVTFSDLFSSGYLPVTCAELRDSTNPGKASFSDSAADLAANSVTEGKISTNYRVSSANMVIADANGTTVQSVVRYANQAKDYYSFDLSEFASETVYDDSCIKVSSLAAGNYHCTVSIQIATGEILVVRDFNFAV